MGVFFNHNLLQITHAGEGVNSKGRLKNCL